MKTHRKDGINAELRITREPVADMLKQAFHLGVDESEEIEVLEEEQQHQQRACHSPYEGNTP